MLPWFTIFPGWRRLLTAPASTPPRPPSWGTQEHEPRYPSKLSWVSSPEVVTIIGDNPSPSPSRNSSCPPMEKVSIHPPLTPGGANQGRRNGRDRKPMGNYCPIVHLLMLMCENTRDLLHNTALSITVGCTFYKR